MDNYTLFSYIFLLVVGCVVYYHYTYKKVPIRAIATRHQPTRKEKSRKARDKKIFYRSQSSTAALTPISHQPNSSSEEEGAGDKDFVPYVEHAKTKHKSNVVKRADEKVKSLKHQRAEQDARISKLSAPLSTSDMDTDDHYSEPTIVQPVEAAIVSERLEKPSLGPSVLRVKATNKTVEDTSRKASKNPDPTPTKKQRQNRRKAEQKKILREEDEKERKKKLEAQRRLARDSEGRAALDGTAPMMAKETTVWKTQPSQTKSAALSVSPLDTFDEGNNMKQGSVTSDAEWIKTLPSEEEQIELVLHEAAKEQWATVESKSSKRKQRKDINYPKTSERAEHSSPKIESMAISSSTQSSLAAFGDSSQSVELSDESKLKAPRQQTDSRPAVKAKTVAVETEWDI